MPKTKSPMRRIYVSHDGEADEVEAVHDLLFPRLADLGLTPTGKDEDEFDVPAALSAAVEQEIERINARYGTRLRADWSDPQ